MTKNKPSIAIVGAGPGDPDLITLKAAKALQQADAVLYDALANPVLLDLAPEHAVRTFVGKRAGLPRNSQEEINLLLIQHAFEYGKVVRLKGGDPFIFGRGYEELEYVRAFGIEAEIIPGLSSATSLAGLQQVPLTSRGYSEGFWVITGTTRTGQLSTDVQLAAQSKATVVILMGMRKLPEIADLFSQSGKGDLPAMVIQNGSLPGERVALGKVDEIVSVVQEQKIGTPGIIVIGPVVGLHPHWSEIYQEAIRLNHNTHQNGRQERA